MPIMRAHIQTGYLPSQKQQLIVAYTDAVVDSLGAPRHQVRVMLEEMPWEDTAVAGVTGQELSLIQVFMMDGRTEAQKAALIHALTVATAVCLSVTEAGVRVLIHDLPKMNVGIGGQSAKALGR